MAGIDDFSAGSQVLKLPHREIRLASGNTSKDLFVRLIILPNTPYSVDKRHLYRPSTPCLLCPRVFLASAVASSSPEYEFILLVTALMTSVIKDTRVEVLVAKSCSSV
ncbi:hypothetical protein CLCR_06457 [Cladophialophora carrionii]|uniref:Uncharacterized protein n=1 Tax=Cladophialophora carrionii TaxID=86049 RepID=A0A1C1C831_9EURO|nr:hypothetical protein CLCR_06457 [Cladophialophora carrionii]